jgi:hypothetical protein
MSEERETVEMIRIERCVSRIFSLPFILPCLPLIEHAVRHTVAHLQLFQCESERLAVGIQVTGHSPNVSMP